MELISSLHEAILNLLSAKLRSFLAILGVLVGTGSVVALISSSQLATAHALSEFKTLGTNLISVYLRDDGDVKKSAQERQFLLSDVPILQRSSPEVTLVAPYTTSFQPMYFDRINLDGQILGVTKNFATIAKLKIAQGRFISDLDHHNLFCVIGDGFAKKIKEATLKSPLKKQIRVGKTIFTIVGVLQHWPGSSFMSVDVNNSILIPLPTSYFLQKNTRINDILMRLVEHPDVSLAKKQVTEVIRVLLPQKKPAFNSPEQFIQLIAKSRETYTMLLIAIGSISLVVGGIGVMNIMLVSVIERRREIGIRMAIGARQSDILRMFLIESVMLTIFGGFLGVVFGVFTSYVLALFSHWQFYFYGAPIILGFAVSVLVGILSGFYPALRASKLDPIQTLMS